MEIRISSPRSISNELSVFIQALGRMIATLSCDERERLLGILKLLNPISYSTNSECGLKIG